MLQYPHKAGGGDAIGSGYLYRGKNIPALRGKYVFTDISTGRLWYVDYQDLLKADDGNPDTMAERHEIQLRWDDPHDAPDAGKQIYPSMYPIAMSAYHARGGGTDVRQKLHGPCGENATPIPLGAMRRH